MNTYAVAKSLPSHLTNEESERFEAKRLTHFLRPMVVKGQNAFITTTGICFELGQVYSQSFYHLQHSAKSIRWQCMLHYLFKKVRTFESPCFFIHTPFSVVHYYYWMVDSLPRLVPFLHLTDTFTLLLPEKLREVGYIQEILKILGFHKFCYFGPNEIVKASRIHFDELNPGNFYLNEHLKPLMRFLKEKAGCKELTGDRKIFLLGNTSGCSVIHNLPEVQQLLRVYGFEHIETGELSFQEQITLFSQTTCLIAMHGASLTNCLFMPEGASVLELHPSISNPDEKFQHTYWNLAHHFRLHYFFLGCEPTTGLSPHERAHLTVNLSRMEQLLQAMPGSH